MSHRPGIVHLGVGAFARAHLAVYTQGAGGWGIVAFTGRSSAAADALTAQDCRYTLVVRGADGDTASAVDTIVAAFAGSDDTAWRRAVASPETAIVTLTVTENGYRDSSDVAARLVDGLRARRAADAGPITLMSLDNLTDNGAVLAGAVRSAVGDDAELRAWIDANVTFPSSMVDRITPATTDADVAAVATMDGAVPDDLIPVVTEPFTEWVITDDFAGDRPAWESAGAQIVPDVEPYEQRKLWLLNGSHSLLAYLAPLLGHETVADAIADPFCRDAVEDLWDEAEAELRLPSDRIADARAALRDRFANPRIRHTLRQIASDGSSKLPVRIGAPLARRLARDPSAGVGHGAATAIAAWWLHCTTQTALVNDPAAPGADARIEDVLAIVLPDADADADADATARRSSLVAAVAAAADRIRDRIRTTAPATSAASAASEGASA